MSGGAKGGAKAARTEERGGRGQGKDDLGQMICKWSAIESVRAHDAIHQFEVAPANPPHPVAEEAGQWTISDSQREMIVQRTHAWSSP